MLIKVKEITNNYYYKGDKKYQIITNDNCCIEMIYAREDSRIKLIAESHYPDESQPVMYPTLELVFVDTILDYDDNSSYPCSYDNENTYEIKFCPFCGNPVAIKIVEKQDITEEYGAIVKTRDELNIQRRHIDSKKKEQELDSQIKVLDKQIQQMWS